MASEAVQEMETEGTKAASKVAIAEAEEAEVTSDPVVQERCTKQHAPTVARRPRYHSNQLKADLYIAESASRTTDHLRDIRLHI